MHIRQSRKMATKFRVMLNMAGEKNTSGLNCGGKSGRITDAGSVIDTVRS